MNLIKDTTIYSSAPIESRSEVEDKTYTFLREYNIPFSRVDHDEANTIADCREIEKVLGAEICKNLFLKNSAKTQYYLLLMDGNAKFDSKVIARQIDSTRLSFADADDMVSMLGIHPGSVSVMGLINDTSDSVSLLIDSSLTEKEYFCCHPCKNTSTLKFLTNDILNRFIPATKHNYTVVNL